MGSNIISPQQFRQQQQEKLSWKTQFQNALHELQARFNALVQGHNNLATAVRGIDQLVAQDHMNTQVLLRTLLKHNIVTMEQMNAVAEEIQSEIVAAEEAKKQAEKETRVKETEKDSQKES